MFSIPFVARSSFKILGQTKSGDCTVSLKFIWITKHNGSQHHYLPCCSLNEDCKLGYSLWSIFFHEHTSVWTTAPTNLVLSPLVIYKMWETLGHHLCTPYNVTLLYRWHKDTKCDLIQQFYSTQQAEIFEIRYTDMKCQPKCFCPFFIFF